MCAAFCLLREADKLTRDIAARLNRCGLLSRLSFCWLAQIFPLASFIGFVAVNVTQYQADDEEQRRQDSCHTGHEVTRTT